MIAAKQFEEVVGGVNPQPEVMFAFGVGVCFKDDDKIATNKAMLEMLETRDDVVKQGGFTNFSIDHRDLTHFLHRAFCHASEDHKIAVDFDGIYPFQALNEQGEMKLYNAQLITLSEQLAD